MEEAGHVLLPADKRNLELLSQAWLLAANPEEAVGPMGQAAKLSDNGLPYVDLARTYTKCAQGAIADLVGEKKM